MKAFIFIAIILVFSACNHTAKNSNRLELSYDIERLDTSSEKVVKGWDGYLQLENNMKLICNTNALNAVTFKESLKNNIEEMRENMPASLRNNNVKKEITDIDKKISHFCSDIKDDELDQQTVEYHLNQIIDAFEDLNVAINKAVASL